MAPEKLNPIGAPALLRVLQVLACVLTAVSLSGCASASYKKGDAASYSLQRAAMDIDHENRAIDVAMTSLDNLISTPSGDLRPQFENFNLAVNRLMDASDRAEKSAAQASKKSAEYFKSWDKDSAGIVYEVVRDQSVARKTQVSDELAAVNQHYHENQAVVEPLISYLKDIRTALSADLTARGVESVKAPAENARQNARKVQTALARLSDDFSASGRRMSSFVMPQAQARGGVGDTTQSSQQRAQSSP